MAWPDDRRMPTKVDDCCRWRRFVTAWSGGKRPRSGAWIGRPARLGASVQWRGPEGLFDNRTPAGRRRGCRWSSCASSPNRRDRARREADGVVRWRRVELKRVIAERSGVDYHERAVGKLLKKLGFSHMSARPRHPDQDERIVEAYKKTSHRGLNAHLDDLPEGTPIEIWFQDEARIGQKNGHVRQWAKRGTRPRQPADQRYDNAYLFGAICPARGVGAALALPNADTEAMQLHLEEISRHVAKGAHAVLLFDRAGWHTTARLAMPKNITPIFLASHAPELNPVENIWQYLRANWLSNRVFETVDDIIDAVCEAWHKLVAQPETITSIGIRQWAHVGRAQGRWYKPSQS